MPTLTPIAWRELVRRLRTFGVEGPFAGGKHPYMIRVDVVVTIRNPHRGDIGIALLQRILEQAGIGRDEWLSG